MLLTFLFSSFGNFVGKNGEVLAEGLVQQGLEKLVENLKGMFDHFVSFYIISLRKKMRTYEPGGGAFAVPFLPDRGEFERLTCPHNGEIFYWSLDLP